MRQFLFFLVAFFISINTNSQILEGKVYDNIATVKGIKVINKTQNSVTATDEEGNFLLIAKVTDTIVFESLFHEPKNVVLKPYHFEDETVFELKKIINELDEIEIKDRPKNVEFNEETYNTNLQNLIEEDIKNNPGLYMPEGANYSVDFFYLIGKVAQLFKRKKKRPKFMPITYEQFNVVLKESSLITKKLLTDNLKIPEDKIQLFLEFCAAKQWDSKLLKPEKKMELLDKLVINSELFLILLEQYGKAKSTKD